MASAGKGSLKWTTEPATGESYVVSNFEGERVTIPGSKTVYRILASSKQTQGKIAVFTTGGVAGDAPGFHYHNEAHDVFLITKGFLKLWNGDKCRILGPGDFAYIPPTIIHNPEPLGPHTETFGLVAPGDWIDFFRYIGEPYSGTVTAEFDNRNIKEHIMGKMMKADRDYDVHFVRDYHPPEVKDFDENDSVIPEGQSPYYLKANTGPRWLAGSVLSRPFVTTAQNGGKFAITSLESSKDYESRGNVFSRFLTFKNTDHCFSVQEGVLIVKLKDGEEQTVREGETAVIQAGQSFSLSFGSKYVRAWSIASGDGVETVIQTIGKPFKGFVLPEEPPELDDLELAETLKSIGVDLD
ncbi:RmlC-like cupin [Microthyrium microscopicum]|uniref:RmlC-like cupin n=1 Tax=Microthyrium microscopicum TaxID=703497 RepID=A0A6A6UD94_9PEZI|nr:RmlC-like cupin [Microthyrium microscopicum]